MNKIRLMVVDDHSLMRIGLATAINVEPDMAVIAEASSGEQAIEEYRRHRPDLVLMDLRLPGIGGAEATALLCREFAGAKVLMLSKHDSPGEVARCVAAGASSFISKSLPLEKLLAEIRLAHGRLGAENAGAAPNLPQRSGSSCPCPMDRGHSTDHSINNPN